MLTTRENIRKQKKTTRERRASHQRVCPFIIRRRVGDRGRRLIVRVDGGRGFLDPAPAVRLAVSADGFRQIARVYPWPTPVLRCHYCWCFVLATKVFHS